MKNPKWGEGPWDTEPDRVEFEAHGFTCDIIRSGVFGHLCGYVRIPEGHPWFGARPDADVHGGVTWADKGRDGVFRVGFDCGHSWDKSPKYRELASPDCVYRTIGYVRAELERLALQAKEAQP